MLIDIMKPEIAFILGALADGSLMKREEKGEYCIDFEQSNKFWLEHLAKNFKKCFNKDFKVTEKKAFND